MFAELAKSLVGTVTPMQEQFIAKYLDRDFSSKKKEKEKLFDAACSQFGARLTMVNEVKTQLKANSVKPEDLEFCDQLSRRTAAVLKSLGEKTKDNSAALLKVQQATQALQPIAEDARNYRQKLIEGGRDLSVEGGIKAERLRGEQKRLELRSAYESTLKEVVDTLQAAAPGAPFDPPGRDEFFTKFYAYAGEIGTVGVTDPQTTLEAAKTTVDGIVNRMQETAQTWTKMLADYAASTAFKDFQQDSKLKMMVVDALAKSKETLAVLDRWDTGGRAALQTEHDRINGQIAVLFAERKGLTPGDATKLDTAQQALLDAARKLETDAALLMKTTGEAFQREQALLLQRLVAMEKTGATLAGKMKGQGAPILDALASARIAITGLNGSNLEALKTAGKMLGAAQVMITAGGTFEATNKVIETMLSEAKKTAKSLSKGENPKSAEAIPLTTEISEYKKVWKTEEISAAKTAALALKARADALETENAAIITARVKIARIIQKADELLVKLDQAFKDMAKNSPAAGRDYGGKLMQDIDMCRSWNATKTKLAFYDTIEKTLNAAMAEIGYKINDIEKIANMPESKVMEAGFEAKRQFDEKIQQLNATAKDGEGPKAEDVLKAKQEYDEKMAFLTTRTDLISESNAAETARLEDERKKAEFLTVSKELETAVLKEQKAAGSKDAINAYNDEVKRHIDRMKQTRDLIRKKDQSISGGAAMSEFDFIKTAFQSIRDRGAKTDKNDLGQIAAQWQKSVDVFVKAAMALMSRIEAFEQSNAPTSDASGKINAVLSNIIGPMNAHNFTKPAMDLGKEDADDATRRAAREAALAEVRRLRKLVFEDPVFQKCVLNPFGVGIGGPQQYQLEEIELNVLRGV